MTNAIHRAQQWLDAQVPGYNPEAVGVVERLTEEAAVRTLRRCAGDAEGA